MKKQHFTKLDIARWTAVLPLTIILLLLYTSSFIDLLYWSLDKFFNEEVVANMVGLANAIILPIIIAACGYWISPKFKFQSTLILILCFVTLQLFHIIDRINNHWSLNPYISLSALSYLLSLYIVYRIENGKRK
jgi:hypothetical protein